ncbi:MAG: lysophospholipid acyltransferase family protein [Opitutaceae bacterium]|jgi:hypothetical protein|nr:lysophospholipid acyltransferase family protein [Opitutaceae bacterium]
MTPAPPATSAVQPKTLAGWKKGLARVAGLLMRTWVATLRFSFSESSVRLLHAHRRPTLFVLWHDRLFIAGHLSRLYRDSRPLHALISASKDGAWLTEFFSSIGLAAVRGSSSRGGKEAATALIRVLREGHDVGITPDGPRGPAHRVKPGALVVARRTGARVVVLGVHYERSWRLRSWDRLHIPHPFSRVHLVLTELAPETLHAPDALQRLEATLEAYNIERE